MVIQGVPGIAQQCILLVLAPSGAGTFFLFCLPGGGGGCKACWTLGFLVQGLCLIVLGCNGPRKIPGGLVRVAI